MKILAADTSTSCGSVALIDFNESTHQGVLLAEYLITRTETHNRRLLPEIDRILKSTGLTLDDIDAFAVGTGPGSFTGLRIGVTTFKTLAWSLEKPLKGVPSLMALARQFTYFQGFICPMIDARKGEVYWAIFESQGNGGISLVHPYSVDTPDIVARSISGVTIFCGDGWLLYREFFREHLAGKIFEPGPEFHVVRASVIASIAAEDFSKGDRDSPVTMVPVYVRPSEAEINHPEIKVF